MAHTNDPATGKSDNKNLIILALITAILVAAAGSQWKTLSTHLIKTSKAPPTLEELEKEKMRKILANDRNILQSGSNANKQEVYGAMVRLAQQGDTLALTEAQKKAQDPDPILREGAADSLGHFGESGSLAALRKLTKDPVPRVRVRAWKALGTHKSEEAKKELVEGLAPLANSQTSAEAGEEKAAILMGLVQRSNGAERQGFVAQLAEFAAQGNEPVHTEVIFRLLGLAPSDPALIGLIKTKIEEDKTDRVVAIGLRYLAIRSDPWIKNQLSELADHRSKEVRLAVIQSIHFSCPKERLSILEKAITKDPEQEIQLAALKEFLNINSEEAKPALQKLAKAKVPATIPKRFIDETILTMERTPNRSGCAAAAQPPQNNKRSKWKS